MKIRPLHDRVIVKRKEEERKAAAATIEPVWLARYERLSGDARCSASSMMSASRRR